MQDKKAAGQKIIQSNAIFAAAGGAIPVPLLDVGAVTLVQLDMLKALCRLHNVDYSELQGKAIISALSGSLMARMSASAFKLVPGIGSLLGGISMAAFSAANTYSIGQVFDFLLSKYGSLDKVDIEEIKAVFEEEFEKGKAFFEKYRRK
ncbi:MAG: GTPase [Lewinellaceae bacterium]|nr:GTPase [Lewinellaceae bacterium]